MKRWAMAALLSVLLLSVFLVSACHSAGNPPVISGSPIPPSTGPGVTNTPTTGASPSISNGRNIYFNSISASGEHIGYSGGPGGMMQGPLACVNCHGSEGHGGTVNFMMQTFDVPNITWPVLTGPDMDHPAYTDETLQRAITQGLDPAGDPLEYPMPRWQMSEQDLNDLTAFIKTLK